MVKKRHQVLELYYIRAIAAFGIFTIHATGGFALYSEFKSKAMYLGIFLNQFFRFGTPVFMMVSGFVLFYNYRKPEEFDGARFYKKKATFLVLPYILWSIGYFLFSSYMYRIPITLDGLLGLPKNILLGEGSSHLYFIFLIVQFYIIFPLLIKYLSKSMMDNPFKVFVCTAILQAIILIYEFYFRKPTNIAIINFINAYYWKTFLGWFFYFITGGIIAYHYDKFVEFVDRKIKLLIPFYALSIVLFLGEVYLDIYVNKGRYNFERYGSIRPMNMVYGLLTFAVLVWLTRKIKDEGNTLIRLIKSFGTYSLGVYFAHPMVLEYIKIKLMSNFPNHIGYSRISSIAIIIGLGWTLTILLCYFFALFKWRWLFIGKVPVLSTKKEKTPKVA
ncbi:acyltransferase [Proteiniborus sp. MB09-C3]|uniref:acyltransferase n=1 Tax=Proteiniborus sp. MB09-C3 TaxID=3050072 RepID=UPI002556C1B4|nr:acyltransferase [Proteiniborus sp. MB09-C3]WIV11836.1 acyltransferase [Proteiniborus sp. MB09-C3]